MLRKALGNVDDEWLHHVLHDPTGLQLVALQQEQLIGVVGLILPSEQSEAVFITDFAIAPQLRRTGLGKRFLDALFQYPLVRSFKYWRAYVERGNDSALSFFQKNKWHIMHDETIEDDMIPIALIRP